jgi:hypothetical protein
MAPEQLMNGHISRASDSFAFLLCELWTGEHALLGHTVVKQGMRPVFSPDTPFDWQFLACRCWESDPTIRYGTRLLRPKSVCVRTCCMTSRA